MVAIARLQPSEWLIRAGFIALAGCLGLVAGVDPAFAVIGAVATAFLLLTLADLRIGLMLFVAVSFLEMTSVAQHVGLAKISGIAVAVSWLAQVLTKPNRKNFVWSEFPGIIALLTAFLAWAVLSVVWADDGARVLQTVYRYILNAALFPIVYTAIRGAQDVRRVMIAFLIGATLSALYGIFGPAQAAAGDPVERVAGTIGDPNALAATLAAGFLLSTGLTSGRRTSPHTWLLIRLAGAICIFGMLLTVSRGGLVALFAALLLAPFVLENRGRAVAGIILLATSIAIYMVALAPAGTMERVTNNDGGSGRTDIWKVGWRIVEDRPITGVGVGNFQKSSTNYILQPGSLSEKRNLSSSPNVAHNIYLEIAAELGAVGLLLFLALVLSCVGGAAIAANKLRRVGERHLSALAGGLALALIAILAADFFLSEQYSKQLWLLLALCPAMLSMAHRAEAAAKRPT